MDNSVDNSNEIGYNTSKHDADYEVVKLDEQSPIHDTECAHETLIPNPEDTIGDAVYNGCANRQCGFGWYIRQ